MSCTLLVSQHQLEQGPTQLKQNFYINKVFNSLIDENCNSVIIAFVVALVVGLVVGYYWGVATQTVPNIDAKSRVR